MEEIVGQSRAQRFVVVVFDGVSLGIMSFAFGVFEMAAHYGVLPDLDVRVVSGEFPAAITGGGLACQVPYDLDAIRTADLIIIPNWRDPAEAPPEPMLRAPSPPPRSLSVLRAVQRHGRNQRREVRHLLDAPHACSLRSQ